MDGQNARGGNDASDVDAISMGIGVEVTLGLYEFLGSSVASLLRIQYNTRNNSDTFFPSFFFFYIFTTFTLDFSCNF